MWNLFEGIPDGYNIRRELIRIHTHRIKILFCLIQILIAVPLFAGKIITPWRAASIVVPRSQTFSILYQDSACFPVDSVILDGPYNRVLLDINQIKKVCENRQTIL